MIKLVLQISPDVLISSEESLSEIHTHHFVHFPRFYHPILPLIAPLWASFRSVPLHYRVTKDRNTLDRVVHMIAERNPELNDYQPDLAVVLTAVDAVLSFDQSRTVRHSIV